MVWLETVRNSACGACAARAGCGQPLMSKVLGGKAQAQRNRLPVQTHDESLAEGDRVLLGIPESSVLAGAFWLYLAPIVALLAGAVAGQLLTGNDWVAFALGGLGFCLSLVGVNRQARRWQHDDRWRPRILGRLLRAEEGPDAAIRSAPIAVKVL